MRKVNYKQKIFFTWLYAVVCIVLFYLSIIRPIIVLKFKQAQREKPWYSKENSTRKGNTRDTIYVIVSEKAK